MADEVKDPDDEPLKVEVIGGRLVISIGVRCLAHAIEFAPALTRYNESADEFEHPKVTDPLAFAHEIDAELSKEEEDGTTVVHRMLDKAAQSAIENGAEGIHCPGD